jgi:formate dehydrogenase major subunit
MARRDNSDPGTTARPGWAWAWPANRRILYNRASADPPASPGTRSASWSGGTASKWVGSDVPDFKADSAPEDGMGPSS